jgi:hypothetical protein
MFGPKWSLLNTRDAFSAERIFVLSLRQSDDHVAGYRGASVCREPARALRSHIV